MASVFTILRLFFLLLYCDAIKIETKQDSSKEFEVKSKNGTEPHAFMGIPSTTSSSEELPSEGNEPRKAIAVVTGPTVRGNITFIQNGKRVIIVGRVTGLTKGLHGFHIHEKGDLSNGCASTGSHFNPDSKNHGSPTDNNRHIGDLGNILADDQGVAMVNITDDLISLTGTKRNILGRAVVIHADTDDLGRGGEHDSMTTGHAGARVACGIVGTLSTGGQASLFTASTTALLLVSALTLLNNLQ